MARNPENKAKVAGCFSVKNQVYEKVTNCNPETFCSRGHQKN